MLAMIRGGQSEKATAALWEIEEVKAAHSVTGMCDVTASVEADALAAPGQLVIARYKPLRAL